MTVTLVRGDAAHLPLPDSSVDLVVTSPPYFALRSYQDNGQHYPGQIGSEATPGEFIDALITCTREWIRVLKPSGSMWINLGDSYSAYNRNRGSGGVLSAKADVARGVVTERGLPAGAPRAKSLMGLPWRYALRCIDDLGLILRAEVIWSKPNGLPESVTDRVRRSHEVWFHLTKQQRYYAAVDTIREPYDEGTPRRYAYTYKVNGTERAQLTKGYSHADGGPNAVNPLGKLPGSVWNIPSQPLTVPANLGVDHFAAFPMEWPRRLILGWSPSGICTVCGEGRRPVSEVQRNILRTLEGEKTKSGANGLRPHNGYRGDVSRTVTGECCACPTPAAPTRPAVVLDPFSGTGTVCLVADVLGRHGVGVDMSADYCRLARWRTTDPGERARAMQVDKPEAVLDGQMQLFA